jgi:hypothetical protein
MFESPWAVDQQMQIYSTCSSFQIEMQAGSSLEYTLQFATRDDIYRQTFEPHSSKRLLHLLHSLHINHINNLLHQHHQS